MIGWNGLQGGASGGIGGLGGIPAQAGFDAGNFTDFFTLPDSRTADILNLQNTTNIIGGEAGDWLFSIQEGGVPGSAPDNPLLPVIENNEFTFDFNIDLNERIFIDPVVSIGYDYVVDSGPNFASVVIPSALPNGDNTFELLVGGSVFTLLAGDIFDLASLNGGIGIGFDHFSIRGINTNELLDPNNPFAFVTGLTFVGAGNVDMRQIPVTFNTGGHRSQNQEY